MEHSFCDIYKELDDVAIDNWYYEFAMYVLFRWFVLIKYLLLSDKFRYWSCVNYKELDNVISLSLILKTCNRFRI